MKTFVTTGVGSQQSIENIQDEKIPVYDTLSDAQSDLANLAEGQIIATRDYGTPTPVIPVVDTVADGNMNAVTSNAVYDNLQNYTTTSALEAKRSYSTTEVDTGKKWIDGKPIYRIVISGTTPSDGVNVVADLSSYNISEIVLLQQAYEDNSFLQGNYYASGSNRLRCLVRKSDLNVLIDAYTDVYYKVIIEYTKTV